MHTLSHRLEAVKALQSPQPPFPSFSIRSLLRGPVQGPLSSQGSPGSPGFTDSFGQHPCSTKDLTSVTQLPHALPNPCPWKSGL